MSFKRINKGSKYELVFSTSSQLKLAMHVLPMPAFSETLPFALLTDGVKTVFP
jgi:hypothetical protein